MSKQYPGGIISKTPPVPSGPYSNSTAPGVWTLDQQAAYAKQGQWPTQGNTNPSLLIENLFQTWLYTGNGSTQTITNGIDLSTNGGLVWIKGRDNSWNNIIQDTNRGINSSLSTNNTDGVINPAGAYISSFNSTGFSIGNNGSVNFNTNTYTSWTFREQAKFFDVLTYTGDGTNNRTIAHNLTSTPGCIIVKRTDSTSPWYVFHRSTGLANFLVLNTSDAVAGAPAVWDGAPTSTTFTIQSGTTNINGATYVAYLWAHDAGGFGVSGSENVVSCGSYTGNGSATGPFINLGYEAQWVMIKKSSDAESWYIYDNMRGVATLGGGQSDKKLRANSSGVEGSLAGDAIAFNATGFNLETSDNELNNSGSTYIYVAIRRGPMAVPTLGTTVFSPQVQTPTGGANNSMAANSGFPIDWLPTRQKDTVIDWYQTSRLTNNYMQPNTTNSEGAYIYGFDRMSGVGGGSSGWNTNPTVSYAFRRAPSFFDVVCYTGTGSATTQTHNLGVVPELMIVRQRSGTNDWVVYSQPVGNTAVLALNLTSDQITFPNAWNDTTPTSSVFTVGISSVVNASAGTYVAYLFATCAGVSKVGSYTGTGALQTVNCGFTSGARFILIKRTDATGDWWVYNSASGITSGNDPYLLMNSTAAEVTGTNYVDTTAVGFQVTAAAPAGLNASGGTYIFLAIA
jgi:hypothetical protein